MATRVKGPLFATWRRMCGPTMTAPFRGKERKCTTHNVKRKDDVVLKQPIKPNQIKRTKPKVQHRSWVSCLDHSTQPIIPCTYMLTWHVLNWTKENTFFHFCTIIFYFSLVSNISFYEIRCN